MTNSKKLFYISLLIFIGLFNLINNIVWISLDGHQDIGCETVYHFQRTFEIYNDIKSPTTNYLTSLYRLLTYPGLTQIKKIVVSAVPSGYALLTTYLGILFNSPFQNLVFFNIFYLLIIIYSTYGIGKHISDKRTGLLAAYLISFYPMIYGISRKLAPEFALIALVALFYYLLLKSDYLKNLKSSSLLIIIGFFGILIQPYFITYIMGGLLWTLFIIIKQKNHRIQRTASLAICGLLIFIALLFCNNNIAGLKENITETFNEIKITLATKSEDFVGNADKGKNGLFLLGSPTDFCPCTQITDRGMNLRCLSFYPFQTFFLLSPLFAILFIISLFPYIQNRKQREKMLCFLWIIIPYIVFALLPRKWGRFVAPTFPVIAIITAAGIMQIKKLALKKIFIALILIGGLSQFFYYSYSQIKSKPPLCDLNEGLFAHKYTKTNYASIAKKIGLNALAQGKIEVYDITLTTGRFSDHWYNDLTLFFCVILSNHSNSPTLIEPSWALKTDQLKESTASTILIIKDTEYSINNQYLLTNFTLSNEYTLTPANLTAAVYKRN